MKQFALAKVLEVTSPVWLGKVLKQCVKVSSWKTLDKHGIG